MQILNIAGYKFIQLTQLPALRDSLFDQANRLNLKGTILLSVEGINLSLAGEPESLAHFVQGLKSHTHFSDLSFRESYSTYQPFKRMRVKIKKEIITLREPNVDPINKKAPVLSPQEFKQWLDEKRDITLLDTRNDYEMRFGTFENAKNLALTHFGKLPDKLDHISRHKPVVMFCTGGIRCEKAALLMLNAGYEHVYQLQGGILNYFAEVGGSHYVGECFVFDSRVAVNANLATTDTKQCRICQGPMKISEQVCSLCVNQLN